MTHKFTNKNNIYQIEKGIKLEPNQNKLYFLLLVMKLNSNLRFKCHCKNRTEPYLQTNRKKPKLHIANS